MLYNVRVGEELVFEVNPGDDGVLVNGQRVDWDMQATGSDSFHVLVGTKSYDIRIAEIDQKNKQYTIVVNGRPYPVKVGDELDILLQKMGMGNGNTGKMGDVKAPMPGLVIDILVKEGDTFQKGDSLIVLEAMKMENVIKSSGSGTVKAIQVKKRDTVDKNQLLIEIA
jgi:biotin carboxyl carrier protein